MPQKVSDEEVAKLKAVISGRKTHKKSIERDLLIIDLLYNAGLRLSELTNLRFNDLRLTGKSTHLKVLQGKGGKDRDVNLNPYILGRLKSFTKGMTPESKIIGIAPKTVNSLFTNWAKRVGVPQLHPHSLRHKFATDILNRGGSIRDVQHLMGHDSLATTESYLAVTDESLTKTLGLLDNSSQQESSHDSKEFARGLEQVNESLIDIKKGIELQKTNIGPPGIDSQFSEGPTHKKVMQDLAKRLASNIDLPPLWKEEVWRSLPFLTLREYINGNIILLCRRACV